VTKTTARMKTASRTKRIALAESAAAIKARAIRDRAGKAVFPVVAIFVVFGSLLGTVVVQTFIVQNRVKLDAVTTDLSGARERNQQLRLEVIELEAPKRILDTAITRIGMVRPEERVYLPGVDPTIESIAPPAPGDPFGPAVLPDSMKPGGTTSESVDAQPESDGQP